MIGIGQFKRSLALAAVAGVFLSVGAARGQTPAPGRRDGLLSVIPPKAVLFIERRGHQAIREVFLKSNLGKMATDDAVNQFVHESRVRIGRMIVKQMFDLTTADQIVKHQKLLHELLKPFWYDPSAMYVVLDEKGSLVPGAGFICMPGEKRRKGCADALAALMKVGLPPEGQAGTRQTFTYRKGMLTWTGVAKAYKAFRLRADAAAQAEELKERSLFMVSWDLRPLLLVATNLDAADAMASVLAGAKRAKEDNPGLKVVMKKTALTDWAFRWHVDVEAILKTAKASAKKQSQPLEEMLGELDWMGLRQIRGLGGTGGYVDNVYCRRTYIDAPKATGGLVKLFKAGGSYKPAFKMVPSEATFALAGQIDTKVLLKMIFNALAEEDDAASRPAGGAAAKKLEPEQAKAFKQMQALAAASEGHVSVFATDLQALVGGMLGAGGYPVGFTLDVKDRAQALKAIEELIKLADGDEDDEPAAMLGPGGEDAPARAKAYRKVPIRYIGDMVRLAVLKDRVVLALGDTALKAGIDTALDATGGFEEGGKGEKLLGPIGQGAAVFKMDLAALTKLGWPFLMQMAQQESDFFPFASLPSTGKMVRMLGPEVAVFIPDEGGLLLRSRGLVPLSTKFIIMYPAMMMGLMMML